MDRERNNRIDVSCSELDNCSQSNEEQDNRINLLGQKRNDRPKNRYHQTH